ncbi:hypothetical protein BGZ59_005120 [Podila verticillata]|uniref:RING-CH-type domain-containing protein n=1 Tax=Podila verticillata NRRL 6337 TaxID=1069443 RepID=A0A086TJ44_9FUNG|nr:hypothetical protein BGZ59_005120 [Podila verticillata]KFH61971.1 hypothetical protein MVEG_12125 [Podila verticillata NRRL 6337]
MADHHAGDAISTPTKTPSHAVSDLLDDDNDYDEVVAEDWNDMDPTFGPKPTSGAVLPSLLTDKEAVEIDIKAEASAKGPPTLHISTIPSLLAAELADSMGLPKDVVGEEDSNPKSACSSSSEYSLLPSIISSDQSRKNSMTGISETQAMSMTPGPPTPTPEPTLLSVAGSDGDPTIGSTITSPSFSDFVQVTGDNSDFSVETSRSSSSNTPSEDVPRDDLLGEADQDQVVPARNGSGESVPAGALAFDTVDTPKEVPVTEPVFPHLVQVTQATTSTSERPSLTVAHSEPSSSSTPSPPIKRMYRTTVEDARSSEEEAREPSFTTQELRYRGHAWKEDTKFSNVPSGTMPGGLNLGLDADISHFGPSAATPVNDPPLDERQCRICLGGVDEEDTLGRLISPCLCKGSMKYVHVECLNAWRERSPKKESHYKCDTCKYSFSFRRTSFARYLAHPLTVFVLTILVFITAVFAAGFVMKLLLYLTMDEAQEFVYPADLDEFDEDELIRLKQDFVIFKTPDSLRAVFRIDKTHMVFGSFFVSIIGFLQLLLSTIWMGGGGGVFRIGGFGLGGGRRRGERQREAGIGGVLMVMILVFGLFKSVYSTYQFVNRMSRKALAKAELMVLEVQ